MEMKCQVIIVIKQRLNFTHYDNNNNNNNTRRPLGHPETVISDELAKDM